MGCGNADAEQCCVMGRKFEGRSIVKEDVQMDVVVGSAGFVLL